MGNLEEKAGNASLNIESSSCSLLDVSWLSSMQLPELDKTSAPEVQEICEPVYLPKWMGANCATICEHLIRIRVDDVYHEFPVEKYPMDEKEAAAIEERIKKAQRERRRLLKKESLSALSQKSILFDSSMSVFSDAGNLSETSVNNTNSCIVPESDCNSSLLENTAKGKRRKRAKRSLFFLWERDLSEKGIARKNINAIRKYENSVQEGLLVRPSKVADYLTVISLKYKVSFVHLTRDSLESALSCLEASICRNKKETGPALKLKKTASSSDLLESVIKSISGITIDEIYILKDAFKSLAELSQISLPVEGVRNNTVVQIIDLFM